MYGSVRGAAGNGGPYRDSRVRVEYECETRMPKPDALRALVYVARAFSQASA